MQNDQKPIVGAIILAGALIAGAILLRGSSAPTLPAGDQPVAKQIGLNMRKFDTCMANGKFNDKVQADIDDGLLAGLDQPDRGTPFSVILKSGQEVGTINGARPLPDVMAQIRAIQTGGSTGVTTKMRPVSQDDHIEGNINAEIIVVEYSDFDCPFCKSFHPTMHQIVQDSGGKIAWVYRHFPIPSLHPNAFNKALESECAWEQGGNAAFWKYADKLFEK